MAKGNFAWKDLWEKYVEKNKANWRQHPEGEEKLKELEKLSIQ